MKTIQLISAALVTALVMNPITGRAEDIDLYSGNSGATGTPNVMFVVDNPSSQNADVGPCTYWDGTTPSEGSKAIGNDQCALANIVHGMATKADGSALFNLGMTTMAGVIFKLTPVNDSVYTGSYSVPAGTTNRQAIILAVKALITHSGGSGQGSELQETWAYYTGGNGGSSGMGMLSGVTYPGTNAATGCQKNYAIYLSAVKSNASHAQDNNESPLLFTAIDNAVAASSVTAAQGAALKVAIPNNTQAGWGREWARFMNSVDNVTAASGVQAIITYSVATGDTAVPPGAITNDMEKYIQAVSTHGGGKYFGAGTSYTALYQYLLKILNEIQAINSVFASSSLPVSVNAQGTFLNQIYMGMFRPDASGLPRWLGNLKQYQFGYNASTQTLSLVDSLGDSAIDSAGSGFISANAVSFWTTKNTAVQPDSGGGFWKNVPGITNSAGGGYDSPDGEWVEKGGAAQVLRLANLYNDYSTTPGPRKMYTHCPSGIDCVAALSDNSNAFITDNANITATMLGSSNISVKSIERTGTTALVTTNSPHNYTTGDSVTISNATQTEYNVTQNVTVNSTTTFTITGLTDYPSTPNTGVYTAALHNSATQSISSVTVATSTTANANGCTSGTIPNINCNQATVTLPSHGYSNLNSIVIAGVSPSQYSGTFTIGNVTTNTFTYNVPVTPTSPSVNAYTASSPIPAATTITQIKKTGSNFIVTATNSFTAGQSVTISGNTVAAYNATFTVSSPTSSSFNINSSGNPGTGTGGTATLNLPVISIAAGNISRASATATTATATGITASTFSNGQTVNLRYVSGSNTNETAYAPLSGTNPVVITCSGTCTSFTFPITTTPTATLTTSSPSAALGTPVTIPAGAITRTGATVTVTGVANTFTSGQFLDIGVSGTAVGTESAYLSPAAGWEITCPGTCSTSFTFGPVTLTPSTPATGTITVYSGAVPVDKTSVVNWVRGQDNLGDEASPDTTYTAINVRPSLHGDVLHSRPTVINYGGTIGVVVFYGANDTAYRAINGNQTNPASSTLPAPGSELWSFIPVEFYGSLTRLHDNSPVLQLTTTPPGILPSPQRKNYFVDGSTSVYQKINAGGTTDEAIIYLAMRRGGSLLYALDVTDPTEPLFKWKIDTTNDDFTELGQTWSQPKVSFVKGYANPVLIFGAGYDASAEDAEPPTAGTVGRGIFIVDAFDGHMVWHAKLSCTGAVAPCTEVPGMIYSIPSDITLIDRSGNDGYIDRLYATDVGGNVWRVDLEPTAGNTPINWQVTQLAALGCSAGACASGTTPRKFFYPADMVPSASYDAVLVGSGDREHPLYSQQSYSVANRFYMVKDLHTGNDATTLPAQALVTESGLKDITPVAPATTTTYDATLMGYRITLGTGEKVVNAPTTVAGYTYFGTNQPAVPSANSCTTGLGIARGYRIQPLSGGSFASVIYDGGGLPPTAVAGSVIVNVNGVDTILPFCIGCGGNPDSTCKSAICSEKPDIDVSTKRNRTYWYIEKQ